MMKLPAASVYPIRLILSQLKISFGDSLWVCFGLFDFLFNSREFLVNFNFVFPDKLKKMIRTRERAIARITK